MEDVSGLFLVLSFIIEILELNANCVDSDQMPHSVASDLGLHCLPLTLLWDARLKWVKGNGYTPKRDHCPGSIFFLSQKEAIYKVYFECLFNDTSTLISHFVSSPTEKVQSS